MEECSNAVMDYETRGVCENTRVRRAPVVCRPISWEVVGIEVTEANIELREKNVAFDANTEVLRL